MKFSLSLVAVMVPPNFTLWAPIAYATSAFTPKFVSLRSWLTVPGWSAKGSALGVYVRWSCRTKAFAVNSVRARSPANSRARR